MANLLVKIFNHFGTEFLRADFDFFIMIQDRFVQRTDTRPNAYIPSTRGPRRTATRKQVEPTRLLYFAFERRFEVQNLSCKDKKHYILCTGTQHFTKRFEMKAKMKLFLAGKIFNGV
jgi:hypothetical protein